MPEYLTNHIYIGRWAVCMLGKIGKIERVYHRQNLPVNGVECEGRGIDGLPWKAHSPRLLHKSYNSVFEKMAK